MQTARGHLRGVLSQRRAGNKEGQEITFCVARSRALSLRPDVAAEPPSERPGERASQPGRCQSSARRVHGFQPPCQPHPLVVAAWATTCGSHKSTPCEIPFPAPAGTHGDQSAESAKGTGWGGHRTWAVCLAWPSRDAPNPRQLCDLALPPSQSSLRATASYRQTLTLATRLKSCVHSPRDSPGGKLMTGPRSHSWETTDLRHPPRSPGPKSRAPLSQNPRGADPRGLVNLVTTAYDTWQQLSQLTSVLQSVSCLVLGHGCTL